MNAEDIDLTSIAEQTFKTFRPAPKLSLSEFCNEHLKLSPEFASTPGNYRWERCAYQKEILDVCGDPEYKTVTLSTAAQIGKTVILQGILLYYLQYKPSPILVLQPNIDFAKSFSRERVTPMVRDSGLQHLLAPEKSRDSSNTILQKTLANGSVLNFVGANSPSGLAGRSVRLVLADEISRYPASAGTEGDPLALATKRTQTFHDAKLIFVSTPTDENCRINQLYKKSDQRTYHLKCVHCGEHFKPVFDLIKWDKTADGKHKPETALLHCPHCGSGHNDAQKNQAVRYGIWVKENPESKEAGFSLNSISSPFVTLEYMVTQFLDSKNDINLLKKFVNTDLGEVFVESSDNLDNFDLISRVEPFDVDSVPVNVALVTGGVDVQRDRIELTRLGHAPNSEKYVISHDIFSGDVTTPAPWIALKEALEYELTRKDGVRLKTFATAIDSGDGVMTERVYAFVNSPENHRLNLRAIKGSSITGKPLWPTTASQSKGKSKSKVYVVGSDTAKDVIYQQLKNTTPGPGYIHFSDTLTPEYFQQLTVERKVLKFKNGQSYWIWIKKDHERNETLDTFVYALCMFTGLNRRPEAVEKKLQARLPKPIEDTQAIVLQPEIKEEPKPTPKPVTRPPIRKSKFSSGRSWV